MYLYLSPMFMKIKSMSIFYNFFFFSFFTCSKNPATTWIFNILCIHLCMYYSMYIKTLNDFSNYYSFFILIVIIFHFMKSFHKTFNFTCWLTYKKKILIVLFRIFFCKYLLNVQSRFKNFKYFNCKWINTWRTALLNVCM